MSDDVMGFPDGSEPTTQEEAEALESTHGSEVVLKKDKRRCTCYREKIVGKGYRYPFGHGEWCEKHGSDEGEGPDFSAPEDPTDPNAPWEEEDFPPPTPDPSGVVERLKRIRADKRFGGPMTDHDFEWVCETIASQRQEIERQTLEMDYWVKQAVRGDGDVVRLNAALALAVKGLEEIERGETEGEGILGGMARIVYSASELRAIVTRTLAQIQHKED